MLTGFSLNLLSQGSSGYFNLPRNPMLIMMNMPITFQDDYFPSSLSSSLSHSVLHLHTFIYLPPILKTSQYLHYIPAGYNKGPSFYQSPTSTICAVHSNPFHLLKNFVLILIPFLSCINLPPLDHFKKQMSMSSNSYLKK